MIRSGREFVVFIATCIALYAVALTEILSHFEELKPVPIAIGWGVFALATAVLVSWPHLPLPRLTALEVVPAVVIAFVLSVTLLTLLLCPPNNWDVILYHLPRQVQWLQQGSVEHFPTQDYRLTVNPPFAEYLGVHLLALTGSDRFNSVVSLCSFGLTLIAVSLVARELGVSRLGQWLAAAFAATIPMAIHESVSGKNDGLVAFWHVLATWWLLRLWNAKDITITEALLFGSVMALLALTKGTGAIFAAPIVLLWLVRDLRTLRIPLSEAIKVRVILAIVVLAITLPHLIRNERAYGSFAGQTFGLGNERHDGRMLTSNMLRNIAMHFASPSDKWNLKIERWIEKQHSRLGIASNDPATTWGGTVFRLNYCPHQEQATAPGHALLLVPALTMLFWKRSWMAYSLILIGGFVLFCFAFKWQPWHPRLHLPMLSLGCIAIGWMFSQPYVRVVSPLVVAAMLGIALPALMSSEYRSLAGSRGLDILLLDADSLRFLGRDDVLRQAIEITSRVGDADRVDLINHGALPWEYPLTRLLKKAHNRHVGYFYPVSGSPWPEPANRVIALGDAPGPMWLRHESGFVYERSATIGPFTLYRPATGTGSGFEAAVGRFGIGAQPPRERSSP